MNEKYVSITSEIHELEDLIADTPEEHVIDRTSLESRLEAVRELLETARKTQKAPKAKLTFRGKPVFDGHGISADFGAKAAGAFSDAFSMVTAGLTDGLRHIGPIPNRDKNQLLITGTVIGSFGFEFELPAQPEPETSEAAMEKIEMLLRLAAEGSDDGIAEVIEAIHPRAVKKVYEFLELLVQHQAWCGLEFGDRRFRYTDFDQIKASSLRLRSDNIQEEEAHYQGEFQGVLPTGRDFEFKPLDQEIPIRGKVDAVIEDPDILNREWLHKPATIKLTVMRVGRGRPRYTLMSLDDVTAGRVSPA